MTDLKHDGDAPLGSRGDAVFAGQESERDSAFELGARDFDAYAPEKATSNAYSRPRLELKQRALAWARGVVARLARQSIQVDVHGSDEHPSLRNKKRVEEQWVFFSRDLRAREELARLLDRGRSISDEVDHPDPSTRHAFLALRVDVRGVEVCCAVHPDAKVDLDNLRELLREADGADRFVAAMRALPEQFAIDTGPASPPGEGERAPCSAATPEALRSLLDRVAEGASPLRIGWLVARDTALEHAAILGEQLEDAIVALAPIYRLIAWSPDNDRIALHQRLEGLEQERAKAHADAIAQNEKWKAEQAAAIDRSREAAKARRDEAVAEWALLSHAHGGAEPRPKSSPPPARNEAPKRPTLASLFRSKPEAKSATDATTSEPKAKAEPKPRDEARAPSLSGVIEKGARVRVLRGPFAEKLGVIADLDGRGGARVLLGLLSTRLELGDLEAAPERTERPSLQSSHRKPLAAVTMGGKPPKPTAPRKAR